MEYFLVYNEDDELKHEEFSDLDELGAFLNENNIVSQYMIIEGELIEQCL